MKACRPPIFRTDEWDDVEAVSEADKTLSRRRALAEQIRSLNAKRAELKRGSDAFKANAEKRTQLLKEFQTLAPK